MTSSEARDGPNRVSVYISTGRSDTGKSAVPTAQTTDLPGNWRYSRCLAYVYLVYSILLLTIYSIISEPVPKHVFPYHLVLADKNSAQDCLSKCSAFGYPAAGMEDGRECCV